MMDRVSETYSTYEAKAKLSEILRKVESGQVIRISRHGTPIAEVRPVPQGPTTLEERIADLMARGEVTPARNPAARLRPIAHVPGALQRFLDDRNE
jgi:prevent-host-death family protein